mmetsp:Transcript_12736/g.31198  ORF Transcript_12736/g.31198 Transcript_12736/m.31198 type:complete len:360 (-) Transcript_12736:1896-2975(-)
MSTPSMRMTPPLGSTRRYSVIMSVDLPHPVRPHTPTFSRPRTEKLRFCSTGSSSGLYLTTRLRASIAPCAGQPGGGRCSEMTAGAYLLYSTMRSTLFMLTSSSVIWRTAQFMMPVRLSADVMASPARPGLAGSTTATASVVANEMSAPISSRRTDSQRLTHWMGQYARLLLSMLFVFLARNSADFLNARMVGRPCSDSLKCEKMGENASESSRLSSRDDAMYTVWMRQYSQHSGPSATSATGATSATTPMDRMALTAKMSAMDTLPDTVTSTLSVSLVRRLSRRPVGCESKNDMGSRTTLDSSCACRRLDAEMAPAMVITERTICTRMLNMPSPKYSSIQRLVCGCSLVAVSLDHHDSV